MNLPFSSGSDEQKIYCESCGTNLGLKSQPKLSRHSEECLVKISDQNTQGVRRSKSQTEGEQNWFSENKRSWLFFPVYSFAAHNSHFGTGFYGYLTGFSA